MKKLGDYQQGDPRILSLMQIIEKGTPTEHREAREKLSVILGAFQEIARSQTAYNVYKQFGNERNTMAALKNADEQRRVLAKLGVSKEWYASRVDLSKQYQNSPLSACAYNPLQDGAGMPTKAELRLAITISLENESYREWAKMNFNEIELAVKKAEAAREIERQIAEYKRLHDPPTELPDGTLITPDNKENDTTSAYFLKHVFDPKQPNANAPGEYETWLNDTYGKTEWRKKVELVDRVTYEFVSSVIKETVMGGVDTAKFAFKMVMDPQQTTQEMLDSAAYLAKNPEVLVQAAKTVYKNFDEGTPEERAKMLGSVASLLVPGASITKFGKANQVAGGLQDATKFIGNVQDVNKVAERTKSLADMLPFTRVVTPEGLQMIVPKDFPGQVNRFEVPEGNRGVGIAGTGNVRSFVISSEMEKKILDGQRKLPTKNELIGGHSPQINNVNPNYAVQEITVNADGTRKVKFTTQFPDGNLSNIKTSTLFPDSWSNSQIINGIKDTGNTASIGVRASDGATLHRGTVNGVQVEVIKIGDNVVSGYPTGGGATQLLSGFTAP